MAWERRAVVVGVYVYNLIKHADTVVSVNDAALSFYLSAIDLARERI